MNNSFVRTTQATTILTFFFLAACSVSSAPTATMTIISDDFASDGMIPSVHTCDVQFAVRPTLRIASVPANAKSLAIILEDPDVPSGNFVHWVAWNIDPNTTVIDGDTLPPGLLEGVNGTGQPGYKGPCPPSGTHHYHFNLYALNSMLLNLPATTTAEQLRAAMDDKILAEAELVGLYELITNRPETESGSTKTLPGSTVTP